MPTILGVHVYTRRPQFGWNTSPSELEKIGDEASAKFGFDITELRRQDNSRKVVKARRWIVVRARQEGYSFPVIGAFLRRHHTSVINLWRPRNGAKVGS